MKRKIKRRRAKGQCPRVIAAERKKTKGGKVVFKTKTIRTKRINKNNRMGQNKPLQLADC